MSSQPSEPAYKVHIGARTVRCRSQEDRRLLLDAQAIANYSSDAKHFSIGRWILMKDTSQLYCEGKLQRAIDHAIRSIHD